MVHQMTGLSRRKRLVLSDKQKKQAKAIVVVIVIVALHVLESSTNERSCTIRYALLGIPSISTRAGLVSRSSSLQVRYSPALKQPFSRTSSAS